MVLVIDNYDSFTYNLIHYLQRLGEDVVVRRNDEITVADIDSISPDWILLSPGPGTPTTAGITLQVIEAFRGRLPILGVCLGHQAIGQAFGASIVRANEPTHGKVSHIRHDGKTIYDGLNDDVAVTRYHSLMIDRNTLPDCIAVSSETDDGTIMSIRHREYAIEGVQYHPEAILTTDGMRMLHNFITHYINSEERL